MHARMWFMPKLFHSWISKSNLMVQSNTRARHRDHITPILQRLHKLPVEAGMKYKTLSLVHLALHCERAPVYLKKKFKYSPGRALRSSNVVQRPNRACGANAFSVLGARLWNDFPLTLRCIENRDPFQKTSWNSFISELFLKCLKFLLSHSITLRIGTILSVFLRLF